MPEAFLNTGFDVSNPQPLSISDDDADFVFIIEDADSADARRAVHLTHTFGSGESLFFDGSSGGAPSLYTSGDPSYWGSPSGGCKCSGDYFPQNR